MIWIIIAVAVILLAALALAVAHAMGKGIPATHVITAAVHLPRPIEEVFALISRVEAFPSWDKGITRIEMLSQPGEPQRCRMHAGRNALVLCTTRVHEPTLLVREIDDDHKFFAGRWEYHLSREKVNGTDGCKVKLSEYGTIRPAIPRVIMKWFADPSMYLKRHLAAMASHYGTPATFTDVHREYDTSAPR
jgi:uncharacterized protein YndB with AHSA1/START domain